MDTPAFTEKLGRLDKYVRDDENSLELTRAWQNDSLKPIQDRFPEFKILGLGHESLAIVDPNDPESVLTFPREASTHIPKGVMPFSETYNIHRFVSILFPENIAKLIRIQGLSRRWSKREHVVPNSQLDPSFGDVDVVMVNMNKVMGQIGATAWIDTDSYNNFIVDKKNQPKYVDLVVGGAEGFVNLKLNIVRDVISRAYLPEGVEVATRKYQEALLYLRRLAELALIDEIFKKTENPKWLRIVDYREDVEKFNFSADVTELSKKNWESKKRIYLILDKAIGALKSGRYQFSDGRWSEKKNPEKDN